MKTSVIRQRVADFLKRHHPFDALSEEDLLALAGSGKVKFHESDEYLFQHGDAKGPFVWMIEQGRVELLETGPAGERTHDVLGEGDLLGLEQFLGDGTCLYAARTATDVILYGVAAELFQQLPERYPAVKSFLSARFSMSGSLGVNRTSWLDAEAPPAGYLRGRLVTLPEGISTAEAARYVASSPSGAVALVDNDGRPVGALTAAQLCATPPDAECAATLPCPPVVAAPISTRAAMRALLESGGELLAVTSDGTATGRLEGMLTARELAIFSGYDPVAIIDGITRASSDAEIAPLLHQATRAMLAALADPQDADDCARIGADVVSALAGACIRLTATHLHKAGLRSSPVPYCWVIFGASARGDVLRPELPTIAAIYDDTHSAFQPLDSLYFTALAGETASRLHACGVDGPGAYWPQGAQPSMPLSEWKRLYSETIADPIGHDLFARREFFDCRPFSGDPAILEQLQQHILLELRQHELTIPLLANDTLVHLPPLTFFRGLVLELDGAHSRSFDIAQAVVSPIAGAARVFALAKGRLTPSNTLDRLAAAQADFPQGASILAEAADAYRIGLYYQALAGGGRIEPDKFGKFDHLLLKNAFSFIQRFLEFTLSQFVPAA